MCYLFPRLKLPQCFSVFYLLLTSQYKVKLSLFWPGGIIDRSQMSYFGENVLCERYLINVFVLLLLLLLLNCKRCNILSHLLSDGLCFFNRLQRW